MSQPDASTLGQEQLNDLLHEIAAKTPAPGGGAVASMIGAIGAALGQMSMRYSIRKKTPDEKRTQIEGYLDQFDCYRERMLQAADADAKAYGELNRLQRLDENDPQRIAHWKDAVQGSIQVPLSVVDETLAILHVLREFAPLCNRWLQSDLAIAAILAESTARSAAWNVQVNLPLLADPEARSQMGAAIAQELAQVVEITGWIETFCRSEHGSD